MTVVLSSWGEAFEGGSAAVDAEEIAGRCGAPAPDIIGGARLTDADNDIALAALSKYCVQVQPGTIRFNQSGPARGIVANCLEVLPELITAASAPWDGDNDSGRLVCRATARSKMGSPTENMFDRACG